MERFPETAVGREGLVAELVRGIVGEEIEVDDGPEEEVLEGRRGEPPAGTCLEEGAPPGEGPRRVEGLRGRMEVAGLTHSTSITPPPVVSSAHELKVVPKVMHHKVASSSSCWSGISKKGSSKRSSPSAPSSRSFLSRRRRRWKRRRRGFTAGR